MPAAQWFVGRTAAISNIVRWLAQVTAVSHKVVTGGPGSGKTALLGLLATMSDPDRRMSTPADLQTHFSDSTARIDLAIYAGNQTVEDIIFGVSQIADGEARTISDLLNEIHRLSRPVTVLIDALDESLDPHTVISSVLQPIVERGRGKVRLLVGSRPHLVTRLLGKRPDEWDLLDLDSDLYFDSYAMESNVRRTLLAVESPEAVYEQCGIYNVAPPDALTAIVKAIARAAGRSFLVGQIIAGTEAAAKSLPDPHDRKWLDSLPSHAGEAMSRDLEYRLRDRADWARRLLLPLAYAQGNGFPWEDIWVTVAAALSGRSDLSNLDLFGLRRTAGSYIVETTENYGPQGTRTVYRLYHKSLAEHLVTSRDVKSDEQLIAKTLISMVRRREFGLPDWPLAHPYILIHLSTHAAHAGVLDPLMDDAQYMLLAGRSQLLAALPSVTSDLAERNAASFRRTVFHLRSKPGVLHPSYLGMACFKSGAEKLGRSANDVASLYYSPWVCAWANWQPEQPNNRLAGYSGEVKVLRSAMLRGQLLIVALSNDQQITVWDPNTSEIIDQFILGGGAKVTDIAAYVESDALHVAAGCEDGVICLKVVGRGSARRIKQPVFIGGVHAIAATRFGGQTLVAWASSRGHVQVRSLAGGKIVSSFADSHQSNVVAFFKNYNGELGLLSATEGGRIVIWNVQKNRLDGVFRANDSGDPITSLIIDEVEDRVRVIWGSMDGTLRIGQGDVRASDLHTDWMTRMEGSISSLAMCRVGGFEAIVCAVGRTIHLIDPGTGSSVGSALIAHSDNVESLVAGEIDNQPILLSASQDRSVRIWELNAAEISAASVYSPVQSLAVYCWAGQAEVAFASGKTISRLSVTTGAQVAETVHVRKGSAEASGEDSASSDASETSVILDGRHPMTLNLLSGRIELLDRQTLDPEPSPVAPFFLSGKAVLGKFSGQDLVIVDCRSGEVIKSVPVASLRRRSSVRLKVVDTPNGGHIAVTVFSDGSVQAWDLTSGDVVLRSDARSHLLWRRGRQKVDRGLVTCLAVALLAESILVVIGDNAGRLHVIEGRDGRSARVLSEPHASEVADVSIRSRDEEVFLASASTDGVVSISRLESSGHSRHILTIECSSVVQSLAWAEDILIVVGPAGVLACNVNTDKTSR